MDRLYSGSGQGATGVAGASLMDNNVTEVASNCKAFNDPWECYALDPHI